VALIIATSKPIDDFALGLLVLRVISTPSRRRPAVLHGDLLKYMEKNQLSQQGLADKLKVSQGLVWQWLNNVTSITPEKAKEIEEITGIPRIRLLYPDEAK
jgi:hypothetical protein